MKTAVTDGDAEVAPVADIEDTSVTIAEDAVTSSAADEELMQRICQHLEEGLLFLQSRLRQMDVAAALDISTTDITRCLSVCRGITFAQLIAEYRVRYAQRLITDSPDMKLSAIIAHSGFTSESTFFRTFKAVTGLSPKEWLAAYTT